MTKLMCVMVVTLSVVLASGALATYVDATHMTVTADSYEGVRTPVKSVTETELSVVGGVTVCAAANDDLWRSFYLHTPGPANPGTVAGLWWIRYDFDQAYDLAEMWVWNGNRSAGSVYGLKDVTVQYSLTGGASASDWTTAFAGEWAEATGVNGYVGFEGPDFTGASVKSVVITVHSNWGGGGTGDSRTCMLSEVRFNEVPEPATIALLGMGCVAFLRRRNAK